MSEKWQKVTNKQHYVPRLLLRNFGVSGSDKQVGIYNLRTDLYCPVASLAHQAQRHRFYGEQEIEHALGDMETSAARFVKPAVRDRCLPPRASEGHRALVTFAFLQAVRTPYAAAESDEQIEALFRRVACDNPGAEWLLEEFATYRKTTPVRNLATAVHLVHLAQDLGYKLLCNNTSVPFVLSDHPAVLYNQFLEPLISDASITGFAARGLQLFLPLSPRHTLVFFDRDIYDVGGRNTKPSLVSVFDPEDVHALNRLQAVSAEECLYFNHEADAGYIRSVAAGAAPFRRSSKGFLHEHLPFGETAGLLIEQGRMDIRTGLRLRMLRTSRRSGRHLPGPAGVPVRDPCAVAAVQEWADGIFGAEPLRVIRADPVSPQS